MLFSFFCLPMIAFIPEVKLPEILLRIFESGFVLKQNFSFFKLYSILWNDNVHGEMFEFRFDFVSSSGKTVDESCFAASFIFKMNSLQKISKNERQHTGQSYFILFLVGIVCAWVVLFYERCVWLHNMYTYIYSIK